MAGPGDLRSADGRYACKLTPELAAGIVAGVRSGLFDQQNALRHGVDVSTLKSWIERGLDEEAVEPFKGFAEAYLKEAIALEERLLATVMEASEPFEARSETVETIMLAAGFDETDSDVDSTDMEPGTTLKRSRTVKRETRRGDWRAAAWVLERRWPLRWSSARQPDGGPKEAIRLPDGSLNRRRRVDAQIDTPSPELIKAFRERGFAIVRINDLPQPSAADETL
jgi:hypothetical protein